MIVALLSVGTIGQWATVLAVVVLGYVIFRGQAGAALGILTDANRVLEHRVTQLTSELAEAQKTIAALSAKTDIALALTPLLESSERHERHAEARAAKTLTVLDLIAARLGPENGHDKVAA